MVKHSLNGIVSAGCIALSCIILMGLAGCASPPPAEPIVVLTEVGTPITEAQKLGNAACAKHGRKASLSGNVDGKLLFWCRDHL